MTPQDDKTKCDATNYLGSAVPTVENRDSQPVLRVSSFSGTRD